MLLLYLVGSLTGQTFPLGTYSHTVELDNGVRAAFLHGPHPDLARSLYRLKVDIINGFWTFWCDVVVRRWDSAATKSGFLYHFAT